MVSIDLRDKRSPAKKRQQELFSLLGSLARDRSNLNNFARPSYDRRIFPITPLEQRILDAAVYVLDDVTARVRIEMNNLPSKKNLLKSKESK